MIKAHTGREGGAPRESRVSWSCCRTVRGSDCSPAARAAARGINCLICGSGRQSQGEGEAEAKRRRRTERQRQKSLRRGNGDPALGHTAARTSGRPSCRRRFRTQYAWMGRITLRGTSTSVATARAKGEALEMRRRSEGCRLRAPGCIRPRPSQQKQKRTGMEVRVLPG